MNRVLLAVTTLALMGVCGCGGTAPCVTGTSLSVGPATGAADHAAAAPGNQVQFEAFAVATIVSGSGCAVPALAYSVNATWSSSDPGNVSVSSLAGPQNGLATCLGTTAAPVTLTATAPVGAKVLSPDMASVVLSCH